jgi:hypothetical protein
VDTNHSWWLRHRWSLALMGCSVTALVLALVVASGLSIVGTSPTAHAQPTATATPMQLTPPKPGYAYYTEAPSDFQVQYPQAWLVTQKNPGVEFDDNPQNPSAIMQVLLPSQPQDPQTDWVQYELDNLRQTTGATNFQQIGGRAQQDIDGETWTSGDARILQDGTTIAVRVLAAVHHDRVYIINLFAANMTMDTAQQKYFAGMLSTFAFLA